MANILQTTYSVTFLNGDYGILIKISCVFLSNGLIDTK